MLVLKNGQTINKINDDITTFSFAQSTLNMSSQDSGIIKINKIQETSTLNLIECLKRFINNNKNIKGNQKFIQNCTIENLDNIFKELYKRLLIPTYIPILILISLFLIISSKENINYTKYRILIFLIGLLIIIFSETTQKLIGNTLEYNFKIFIIPLIIFILLYYIIFSKIKFKPRLKNKG